MIGTTQLCSAAVPAFERRGGGAIVLIGSQRLRASRHDTPQLAYASSKGALMSAMYQMAKDLGTKKILVNGGAPWMWVRPCRAT